MSDIVIELNSAGIREMLRSPEMQSLLREEAEQIASRCGAGYASDGYMTPGRAVASVYTETFDAVRDNSENNTLLKGLR